MLVVFGINQKKREKNILKILMPQKFRLPMWIWIDSDNYFQDFKNVLLWFNNLIEFA